MKGCMISVEGIDGVGKTTTVDYLVKRLGEMGRDVVRVREPGGTPAAERIRDILKNDRVHPTTETLLFFAARAELLAAVIKPALAQGKIVIADRFIDSTYAYQGFGMGRFTLVKQLDDAVLQGFRPNHTLCLTATYEQVMSRIVDRGNLDVIEQRLAEFWCKTQTGFARIIEQDRVRVTAIDAVRERSLVQADVEHWLQCKVIAHLEKQIPALEREMMLVD